MPSVISRSKRPARLSAGSSASGRLVAPITMTCARALVSGAPAAAPASPPAGGGRGVGGAGGVGGGARGGGGPGGPGGWVSGRGGVAGQHRADQGAGATRCPGRPGTCQSGSCPAPAGRHSGAPSRPTLLRLRRGPLLPRPQVVHAGEHLRHDAPLHLPLRRLPLGGDGVDLVDEHDAGRLRQRVGKQLPQLGLALACGGGGGARDAHGLRPRPAGRARRVPQQLRQRPASLLEFGPARAEDRAGPSTWCCWLSRTRLRGPAHLPGKRRHGPPGARAIRPAAAPPPPSPSRRAAAPPTHPPLMPDTTSGADTRRKAQPHSLAMAEASAVLPQPGGPCSSTPRGGSTPSHAYTCGGRRAERGVKGWGGGGWPGGRGSQPLLPLGAPRSTGDRGRPSAGALAVAAAARIAGCPVQQRSRVQQGAAAQQRHAGTSAPARRLKPPSPSPSPTSGCLSGYSISSRMSASTSSMPPRSAYVTCLGAGGAAGEGARGAGAGG
jgi:hypothetical protein